MLENDNLKNGIKNKMTIKTEIKQDVETITNGIDTVNVNNDNESLDDNSIEKINSDPNINSNKNSNENLNLNTKLNSNFSVEDACKMVKKVFRAAAEREISVGDGVEIWILRSKKNQRNEKNKVKNDVKNNEKNDERKGDKNEEKIENGSENEDEIESVIDENDDNENTENIDIGSLLKSRKSNDFSVRKHFHLEKQFFSLPHH